MATASVARQVILPISGLTAAVLANPIRVAEADESVTDARRQLRKRKSIYDTPSEPSIRTIAASTPSPASAITDKPDDDTSTLQRRPTPTDRLAHQIGRTRLLLHGYAVRAEDSVNRGMDRFMSAEKDFTTTIASLAPPKESNEKLLPGSIYVLVAAMAGSIISRNRNVLIRFATPVVTGVATANYVVPRTTQNIGNFIWSYEEKVPVLRDNHIRAQEGIEHFIETGKAHSQIGLAMAQERVHGIRQSIEEWISKGK